MKDLKQILSGQRQSLLQGAVAQDKGINLKLRIELTSEITNIFEI